MKRYSLSLVIREIKMKTIKHYFIITDAKIKETDNSKFGLVNEGNETLIFC